MKKYLFSLMMLAMGSALVTSCISDDENNKKNSETITYTSGVYVINNGSWGQNNGSLTFFDYGTQQTRQLLNGVGGLGDTPNDAYTKGDTIFVVGSTDAISRAMETISTSRPMAGMLASLMRRTSRCRRLNIR